MVPLRELLSRWSSVPEPGDARRADPEEPRMEPQPRKAAGGPGGRLAMTDALWGEGFLRPGGAEEMLLLAKPLGLSAAQSVLLIGADSGGPPRCIAGAFGSWVSAFGSDEDLVAVAAQRCASAGLGKRATVASWSPAAPAFPENYFHRALALDPLAEASPEGVLGAISRSLKPGSELVLTAVTAGPSVDTARLEEWLALEARPQAPPGEREVCRVLESLGHEVRIAKDITAPHLQAVIRHWQGFVQTIRKSRPEAAYAGLIVREAEIWLRRARLMRAGAIRMMRFHSMGRAGS